MWLIQQWVKKGDCEESGKDQIDRHEDGGWDQQGGKNILKIP